MPTPWAKGGHTPWRSDGGQTSSGSKGRKLVFDVRIAGVVQERRGAYGFITPSQKVDHPKLRGNRIYLHFTDMREGVVPAVGRQVDFFLYCDDRGLGAGDCREVPADEAQVGATDGEEPPTPEGWEKVWCEEHGDFYFWNAGTKESSWEHPGGADDAEKPLPEGWEKHFDSDNKEFYYWHRPTKTSSWERPGAEAEQEEPVQDAAAEEDEEDQDDAAQQAEEAQKRAREGPVLAHQRMQGRVTHWQGSFGWITPMDELPEDLQPLADQGRVYLNWRDLPPGLSPKVGLHLDFSCAAGDAGLVAADVEEHRDGAGGKPQTLPGRRGKRARRPPPDPMAQLEKQWAREDALLGAGGPDSQEPPEEQPDLAGPDAGEGEGELLPGWEQLWSDERRCHYYWHAEAKVAAWERPAVPGDTAQEEDGAEEAGEPEEAPPRRGAPRMATPITPVAGGGAGAEMTPITPAEHRTGFQRPPPSFVPSSNVQAGAIGKSAPSKGGKGSPQPSTGAAGKAGPYRVIGALPGSQQGGGYRPGPAAPNGRPAPGKWPAAKRPRT